MKWSSLVFKLSIFIISGLFLQLANANTIIYGLQNAKSFHKPIKKYAYIQTNSFKSKYKAYKQQQELQYKTIKPIKIINKDGLYTVLVGPLYSSSEIQKTATELLQPQKSIIIQKVSVKKTVNKINITDSKKWFIMLGTGAQIPMSAGSMKVNNASNFPAPYDKDLYSTKASTGAIFSVAAGRRWQRDAVFIPAYSLSLAWQYYFDANVGNTVMQYSDPEFLNYNYNWNYNSNLLLAIAKLNLMKYGKFSPYINGGIGAAFNRAGKYSETPISSDVTPRINPGFAGGNSTEFSYQAGAGLDFNLNDKVIISLGYNYQNLGNFSSGVGNGTWSNRKLSAGTYDSNQVLLSINYLFG